MIPVGVLNKTINYIIQWTMGVGLIDHSGLEFTILYNYYSKKINYVTLNVSDNIEFELAETTTPLY